MFKVGEHVHMNSGNNNKRVTHMANASETLFGDGCMHTAALCQQTQD